VSLAITCIDLSPEPEHHHHLFIAHRAVAVEPVPLFRAFLEFAAARNHLTPWIEVLPAVVAADTSRLHRLTVPLQGPLGTAGLHDNFHQQPHVMQVSEHQLLTVTSLMCLLSCIFRPLG
jgi:hypothetical protein